MTTYVRSISSAKGLTNGFRQHQESPREQNTYALKGTKIVNAHMKKVDTQSMQLYHDANAKPPFTNTITKDYVKTMYTTILKQQNDIYNNTNETTWSLQQSTQDIKQLSSWQKLTRLSYKYYWTQEQLEITWALKLQQSYASDNTRRHNGSALWESMENP